jgi:hypothetical protein
LKTADTEPLGEAGTRGLLVQADDLAVGKHYAAHGVKNSPAETHPIFGQAFKLKAMNLPLVVGQAGLRPGESTRPSPSTWAAWTSCV